MREHENALVVGSCAPIEVRELDAVYAHASFDGLRPRVRALLMAPHAFSPQNAAWYARRCGMPIVDIELVATAAPDAFAQRAADALGALFGSAPGLHVGARPRACA
jgi:hypothetical protein